TIVDNPTENYHIQDILSWKNGARQVTNIFVTTFFLYYSMNYYHSLIVNKKPFVYYLRFTIIYALAAIVYCFLRDYIFPPRNAGQHPSTALYIFAYTLTTLFFIGASLLISYLISLRDEKKQRKVLEEQKMQLEVEKSQANFNFLKAQI